MTAKEVWEKMREHCQLVQYSFGFVCMSASSKTTGCAFTSCPLLKGKE